MSQRWKAISKNREVILQRLKTKLNRENNPTTEARLHLQTSPANIIPARGADNLKNKVQNFIKEAQKVDATATQIKSINELPKTIIDYLASQNLPMEIRIAASLVDVSWLNQPLLTVEAGRAEESDLVGVSCAFAGVAETGTLIYLSGKENPSTLHLLPPTHIAVLKAKDIEGNYESVLARVRHVSQDGLKSAFSLPRAVSWVTGPSRSGDIEQTLLLGVHGPKRLHIVVIGDG